MDEGGVRDVSRIPSASDGGNMDWGVAAKAAGSGTVSGTLSLLRTALGSAVC